MGLTLSRYRNTLSSMAVDRHVRAAVVGRAAAILAGAMAGRLFFGLAGVLLLLFLGLPLFTDLLEFCQVTS